MRWSFEPDGIRRLCLVINGSFGVPARSRFRRPTDPEAEHGTRERCPKPREVRGAG